MMMMIVKMIIVKMMIVKMMMMATIEMIGCDQLMSMEVVCRVCRPGWILQ